MQTGAQLLRGGENFDAHRGALAIVDDRRQGFKAGNQPRNRYFVPIWNIVPSSIRHRQAIGHIGVYVFNGWQFFVAHGRLQSWRPGNSGSCQAGFRPFQKIELRPSRLFANR